MDFLNLIREQAVGYTALTTPEEKQAFLQTQLEASCFLQLHLAYCIIFY